ncbi:MAG: hypothetical protein K6T75_00700 [Acetobacteraceae bacterium]|nr:hypothetical protein [Acetobacteraceae bacterium]
MDASDVERLLDRLEEALGRARRVPLTGKLLVDEEQMYGLVHELRRRLPEELRQARWLMMERERAAIPGQAGPSAGAEGQRGSASSRSPAPVAAAAGSRTGEAAPQAQEVLERARQVAREIRQGALEYADGALREALAALEAAVAALNRGRSELQASRQQ